MARTKPDHPRPKTSDELLAFVQLQGGEIWTNSALTDILGEALQKEIAAAVFYYIAGDDRMDYPPSIYLRKIIGVEPTVINGDRNDSETVLVFHPSEPLDHLTTIVPLRAVLGEYIEDMCELPTGGDTKYEIETRQRLEDLRAVLVDEITAIDRMLQRGL
jgi:hypothetical protein